ncbi:hypothetical protein KAR91_69165 [Candidatus Pacearchaeota archaeon]|nr:hypothetical protein [Candidatus Pacearchaeota archaeon]
MSIKKRIENLPVKPEDLSKWILIGKVKLKAQIAAIKAISKLEEGVAAHAAALSDTQDLAEELLYAEARMGDILEAIPEKKASSGRGTRSLPDGIDKKQSHYAQALSRNEDKIAEVVANARETGEVPVRQHVLKAINVHVGRNSGENEWYTPQEYIDAARLVMGSIDCDPATTKEVNKRIKAKKIYTLEDSGLSVECDWRGNIWMNPPYKQPAMSQFCSIFVERYERNETRQGIILINNVTETDAGQLLLKTCSAVCFPSERVKFLDIDGKPGAPLQGQMLIYVGKWWAKFHEVFSEFGICLSGAR